MKLKAPLTIKEKLLKRRQVATHKEIAAALGMSNHTIAKLFAGEPVRPATIRRVAVELGVDISDIATFVEKPLG